MKRKYELSQNEAFDWANQCPKAVTWLSKLQKKAENAWRLWIYCTQVGKTPDELLALKQDAGSREAEFLLDNFVANPTQLSNSVKVNVVIAVKSFYKHNYRELAKACGQITLTKVFPYRRHTKEELVRMHRAAQNPRDRALITFVWSSAIARDSLTRLTWGNLEQGWTDKQVPSISLSSEIIKGHGIGRYKGVEQHTFLTPEAKRDLIDYRLWLLHTKKVTSDNSEPIFRDLHPPYGAITGMSLNKIAGMLSRRSGVKFGWHDGRRYVETALEQININPNWARKIRGRKVKGEEAPYSRPAVEQLRSKYLEAVPLLEFTQPTQLMELQKRQEVVERLTSKLVNGQPLSAEDNDNIKRYSIKLVQQATQRTRHNGGQVDCDFEEICETQLLSYLQAGWTIVHKLSDGQVIVKR